MTRPGERVRQLLLDADEDHGCGDLPEEACREVPGNAVRLIGAQTLQSVGDRVVDAKTVLPWLLAAVGAPAALTGLLVPVRESGALLPQAALVPLVRRRAVRKWVWVAGGAGQAVSVAVMALATVLASGVTAGGVILAALVAFALSRSLTSIAAKDVLGRTVPTGQRGQVNGWATVTAGAVAITLGVAIAVWGGDDTATTALAVLLAGAAAAWVVAAVVYARVTEPAGQADASRDVGWLGRAWTLVRDDPPFRHYVAVRTLLLVSALSPPFVVTLGAEQAGGGFADLGPFLTASGVAGLLGGRTFGRLADRSSRRLMIAGGAGSALVLLALLALLAVPGAREIVWVYPAAYLLLAFAHTGVRVARKTYVVDLASGNQRTDYVAVSNTAMGALLLVTGAVSSGLAQLSVEAALAFLAGLGLLGVAVARSLPEVSGHS